MRNSREKQSGQAIMELLVMLFAFLICFMGLITVMGLSIANIEIFADAKYDADKKAEFSDFSNDGQEIYSWSYTTYDADKNVRIPFLPKDRPGLLSANMSSFHSEFNNPAYSEPPQNEDMYIFNDFYTLADVNGNFGFETPPVAFRAANLHRGKSGNFNSSENIVLISDRRYFERHKTYSAIEKLIGISLKNLDLENNHSNTAYTPAMKIQK